MKRKVGKLDPAYEHLYVRFLPYAAHRSTGLFHNLKRWAFEEVLCLPGKFIHAFRSFFDHYTNNDLPRWMEVTTAGIMLTLVVAAIVIKSLLLCARALVVTLYRIVRGRQNYWHRDELDFQN